jgi:alkylation response protein AidB-like acyl-CoA dehydrogenase
MDFQPSEDQKALQAGIRSFCEDRIGTDGLQGLEDDAALRGALWIELAELGVFQLRQSQDEGGLGLGMADAVLVFEELGRSLVPGPLVFSLLGAPLIEGAGAGQVVVGGLDAFAAERAPWTIEHLDTLDTLLVLSDAGVVRVDPGQIESTPIESPLDPLTPLHRAARLPEGEPVAGPDIARKLRLEGLALTAALQLGIAQATLDIALAYAKEREQFGRTIGSFQAIKHILADMFARQELARASVYAAGATLDHPEVGDPEQAARGAKIVAGESAMKNARACIQVHGGMGYTWEVPDHYYLKRCWVLENGFGAIDEHAGVLGESIGAAGVTHAR